MKTFEGGLDDVDPSTLSVTQVDGKSRQVPELCTFISFTPPPTLFGFRAGAAFFFGCDEA